MPILDRRRFLVGLLGSAALAASGPLPEIIEKLPEKDFIKAAEAVMPAASEVYSNGTDYGFAKIEWLPEPPYFKVVIPEGFRPMREESDRLGREAIERMQNASSNRS